MRKFLSCCLLAVATLLSLSGFAQESPKAELRIFPELLGGTMNRISSNGKYAVGYITESVSFLFDRSSSEITLINGPEGVISWNEPANPRCEAEDVSNDGIITGNFADPNALTEFLNKETNIIYRSSALVPGIYRDGKWIALERKDNEVALVGSSSDGAATGITADGTKICGSIQVKRPEEMEFGQRFSTVVWNAADGKIEKLYDGCDSGQGGKAWAISDDASVLCGWTENSNYSRGPAVWTPEIDKLAEMGDMQAMSPNGKYTGGKAEHKPFIWTKEKGIEIQPIHEGLFGGSITGIANDGTAVGYSYTAGFPQDRFPFIIKNGKFQDLTEYLLESFNFEVPEDAYLFTPMDISGDGSMICGWNALRMPWVLTFGAMPNNVESVAEEELSIYINNGELQMVGMNVSAISIQNLAGQTIYQSAVTANTANISQLLQGIYLVQVSTQDGKQISRKVAVN